MNTQYIDNNKQKIFDEISKAWDESIVPELMEYIKIPNKSTLFDANWKANGYMDKAMRLIVNWCKKQSIKDMTLEVIELANRTPLLFIDIPGQSNETVLLYGHMDKQPEMKGWNEDLGPWKPVLKNDKLYGRGGADDGYAVFAALTAITTLQRHQIPHARCIVMIEASEESGSVDLPFYLEHLKDRMGSPNFIICLDSGCANYDQMWGTTSLRGLVSGNLTIEVLKEGIHSGLGSGVVPSAFTILRQLLNRIEDPNTGQVNLEDLIVDIPKPQIQQAHETAKELGESVYHEYPFIKETQPTTTNVAELLLNRTWRAQLSITGIDGLPSTDNAGNVTVPNLSVTLSVRIPPTCHPEKAQQALKNTLEKDPPYQANINFISGAAAQGWKAPDLSEWLINANNKASLQFYGKPASYFGEGGTISFMGMLGKMFPQAQFLIAGVLGPQSNAHGPNEFLHIPMAKKLTGCVMSLLASHFARGE